MKQQQLEEQLAAIKHICNMVMAEWTDGHPQKVLALRILNTYPLPTEDSPSGGMVDTKHSKCFDASRPGSSPGKGTIAPNVIHAMDLEQLNAMHKRVAQHPEKCQEHNLSGCYMCHA